MESQSTDYFYEHTELVSKTVRNLLSGSTESKMQMEYNDLGRLSKITVETYIGGTLAKIVIQEYEYDSSGIKVKQTETVDENADGSIDSRTTTKYLNDKQNHTGFSQVIAEEVTVEGQAAQLTTYTIGLDVLSQYSALAGYLSLLADGHGSTRAVANRLGGILQQYSYDVVAVRPDLPPAPP